MAACDPFIHLEFRPSLTEIFLCCLHKLLILLKRKLFMLMNLWGSQYSLSIDIKGDEPFLQHLMIMVVFLASASLHIFSCMLDTAEMAIMEEVAPKLNLKHWLQTSTGQI
ncbi:hypothetical protein L1987_61862 [Smallanthus sonchifolius]|uniref:Uncharacterized protein n=1 Tax=Smallanthus sonchifolius TaxID=185202 RepID=A0ACB9C8W3_9ASTR|nr:hypothetical protein L1987_61862 [Smallanthus sonchifolius]